ncbi:TadE family protein [Cryptosporangium aurantiacum]|uniref:TadE-like protein n=1 Tax=Cryptosporangium aurantiacum TaxID=134849 RepID=A0A1M7R8P8_9ACTN|nr:TadE family protein [Cryptosporangium aurantiacum]SHN42707.1 TadE-like protein [Cryptosporangium aurantiacum]
MLRRRLRGERGSSPVELAILAPAVLLALFASIQVAAVFMARSVALSAAQEASTAERAFTAPPGAGEDRGRSFLARAGDWLTDGQVTVERDGQQVTTTVTGQAISLIPGFTFTVSQSSRGEVERFTTDDGP